MNDDKYHEDSVNALLGKLIDKTDGIVFGAVLISVFWFMVVLFVYGETKDNPGNCTVDGHYRAAVQINRNTYIVRTEDKAEACKP